jgi:DNA-3-methyladenine glycosylase II
MTRPRTISITPKGRFVLAESINFGFGPRDARPGAQSMPMAFTVDGYQEQAGVLVTQSPDAQVQVDVHGEANLELVRAQVARVLSMDIDGTGWDAIGETDPLVGQLQAARPGLRPPLFYSAYEAAAWCILSARRPRQQMAALRDRFSAAHGATFELAGRPVSAFPTPAQLLAVDEFPGLPEIKLTRLQAVARVALDGGLDTAVLKTLDPSVATERLRELAGIGPMYAGLILIRALGHTDLLPVQESHVLSVLGELLGRDGPVEQAEFEERAAAWAPWRTWASVALRAAGPLVIAASSGAPTSMRQPA